MSRIHLLLSLTLLLFLASSKLYNTNISCGACQSTTGCYGNMCLILTGDVKGQYCYGRSTCAFSTTQAASFGLCTLDLMANPCSSGLCMAGPSLSMCMSPSPNTCYNGLKFNGICQGGIVNTTWQYPNSATLSKTSTNLNMSCHASSGNGTFADCTTGDAFGSSCSCCSTFVVGGVVSGTGSCVSTNSPLFAVKASLSGQIVAMTVGTVFSMMVLLL